MHTLKDLLKQSSSVYIFCETEEIQINFLNQSEKEGFLALNGQKPTELFHQNFYGINDDMSIGYVSSMCWTLSYRNLHEDTNLRVNYDRYTSGEDDYIYHVVFLSEKDIPELIKLSNPEINHHIYIKLCDEFPEGISYMQYTAHIYRILTESTWHYHPNQALDLINERQLGIREDFYNKIPPADCALDVGYCCG